jgi:hypothetical protein
MKYVFKLGLFKIGVSLSSSSSSLRMLLNSLMYDLSRVQA